MKLDLVHDIQTAYRKVVDAMARPGSMADLTAEAEKMVAGDHFFPATLLLARMLLDTEVTFCVLSAGQERMSRMFHQLTYAKAADVERADYIFVLHDAERNELNRALTAAKIGDLNDPHQSATLIVESPYLSADRVLRFTGPGIRDAAYAYIPAGSDWQRIREERNAEYPLGVDMIFVDAGHRLIALPRTTRIEQEEAH